MKGYVHVYTGDGKGKTTAALGLALRAAGAGLKTYIGQFVKGMHYSELESLKRFSDLITIRQFGRDCFIYKDPEDEDIRAAREGLEEAGKAVSSGKYDLVILDEATIAIYYNLFTVEELLKVIEGRPEGVEIVITGRKADQRIMDIADLVTEMKEIKHYYQKGVQARDGIEK
ncbi:MAG: cob(I)yrinic acid a,c-diamide adenosyltransferase [Thermoplasmata archaeon]|nr:MAG: cob(I)yrinic acid a,c-diamide adenosyltransferase [Deltaproteobacteria bacterium]RLF57052.1 MAG: cob(I)yrinic acid a,c-diamide adenosyltransferase [Thermoplasmata archaeon]HDZ23596.1 cob(I)yrinic acid a,c-diamide adenosyltransferase [Desulfobacteraceae bacterium]